ncbi:MAG: secretin N-terminal domain-containing protein, partial [candidate division WOR-3 bacterium]
MNKKAVAVLISCCLWAGLWAQGAVAVSDVAVDKVLEGVRVTIACTGTPNVSSFVSSDPPAVVIDIMDAASRVAADRIASSHYPVTYVAIQPSEAAAGVRVTVYLKELVEHTITSENGLVVVNLSKHPAAVPVQVESTDPFANKPPLTLLVQDAEVASIVRMIARQFGLNILVTQDVKALVSVHLNNVPLRTGLEALLRAGICNMVEDRSGVIVVKPLKKAMYGETETRVFSLDHIEATDAAKAIAKTLSELGSATEGFRRVSTKGGTEERSSMLIVSDVPEALDRVAEVLAELDRPVPQISIEAKFIETTYGAEERYGIDWTTMATFSTGSMDFNQEPAIPLIIPGSELYLGKLSLAQFGASLELLSSRGRSRVLANPRTVTLDNQTAKVSMGLDIPVRQVNKDANTGEITYTWRTRSIPIEMEVTPHVTADGMVSMKIKPRVEAITGWMGSADDRQPIVAKREAETQVKVAQDEVVVIGGLVKDEETHNVGKIPLLGDIPLIGQLFRKTSVTRSKSDLMIFII